MLYWRNVRRWVRLWWFEIGVVLVVYCNWCAARVECCYRVGERVGVVRGGGMGVAILVHHQINIGWTILNYIIHTPNLDRAVGNLCLVVSITERRMLIDGAHQSAKMWRQHGELGKGTVDGKSRWCIRLLLQLFTNTSLSLLPSHYHPYATNHSYANATPYILRRPLLDGSPSLQYSHTPHTTLVHHKHQLKNSHVPSFNINLPSTDHPHHTLLTTHPIRYG